MKKYIVIYRYLRGNLVVEGEYNTLADAMQKFQELQARTDALDIAIYELNTSEKLI